MFTLPTGNYTSCGLLTSVVPTQLFRCGHCSISGPYMDGQTCWPAHSSTMSRCTTPSDLHATIRGIASKTKTTSRGMPFGFITSGFMSGPSSCTWATKWLNLVRAALQRTAEMYPHFTPDFLIPQSGPNLDHPMFVAPMPRAQGILLLRRFMLMSSWSSQCQGDLSQLGSSPRHQ